MLYIRDDQLAVASAWHTRDWEKGQGTENRVANWASEGVPTGTQERQAPKFVACLPEKLDAALLNHSHTPASLGGHFAL